MGSRDRKTEVITHRRGEKEGYATSITTTLTTFLCILHNGICKNLMKFDKIQTFYKYLIDIS